MISIIESGALLNPDMTPMNSASATLVGLSTDSKPTGANGWIFSEIDTGKIYIYDAENSQWREWSGGGSGGGGGSDTVILHRDANTGALDKTWQEIHDLLANGKTVLAIAEVDEDGEYKGVEIFSCVEAYWNYDDAYYVTFTYSYMGAPEPLQLTTLSADGYPE